MNVARVEEENENEILGPREWMRKGCQASGISRYIQVLWKLWEDNVCIYVLENQVRREKD